MRVFTQFSPALRWNLIALFTAGLCFWAGLSGLLPSLPLYIEQFGANGQQIGLVMASFGIGMIALRPSMSRLTDNWGRKPAILLGMIAIAAAPLTYLLVQMIPEVTWTLSLGGQNWSVRSPLLLMMLFRAGHGLSIAAFVTGYSALVADLAPPDQRGELIGYMSLVNPIGMALGPALGGFLHSSNGFSLVFLAMASIGGVGLLCALTTTEPSRATANPNASKKTEPKKTGQSKFWSLLWLPSIRVPAMMLMLVGLAFGSLATFIPLYARESNLAVNVGLIYTASAITSFVIRLLVGKASDRYGRGPFISLGLVLYTLSLVVLWLATSEVMVLLAVAIQGAGGGMLIPMVAALMADRSTPNQRGLMFGLCLTGFDVGIALSGPIMGHIADLTSYRDIFAIASLMTLTGLLLFVTTSSKDLPHSIRFALAGGQDIYAVPLS